MKAHTATRQLLVARTLTQEPRSRAALTGSEWRVAQMAADGMPNKAVAQALFVSLRTVETHLTHAHQKLGIASREQLGAALATR